MKTISFVVYTSSVIDFTHCLTEFEKKIRSSEGRSKLKKSWSCEKSVKKERWIGIDECFKYSVVSLRFGASLLLLCWCTCGYPGY